jgi:microcystin-dependent protein
MSTQQQTNEAYPVPLGSVYFFASTLGAKGGFLLADGSAISRDTYWELFEYIGTGYGVGDGATTFNLPDLMTYPYIYGTATQTFIPPTAGGASGSSVSFAVPVGALPSLSSGNFITNTITWSGTTNDVHLSGLDNRKFDSGYVGTSIVNTDSSTGTEAYVTMNTFPASYTQLNPTNVSITPASSGITTGGLQMVAYIKAFTNVGNEPRPKAFNNPIEPPSDSFFAPYENIPSLSGLVLG